MYEAMSIAATGLRNQQRRFDVIADNLANANTDSFKAGRLDFKDAMYTAGITQAGAPYTPNGNQQKGHGVMVGQITKDLSPGVTRVTGNDLDIGIIGDVFISVQTPLEGMKFTRAGNMEIIVDDAGDLQLVTTNGHYVLDENGEIIDVPRDIIDMEIDARGQITFTTNTETIQGPIIGVYGFDNLYGLSYDGNSLYGETPESGVAYLAAFETYEVRQGTLELSNVNVAQEMQLMIRSQRAYQLASRALTTSDQMEGLANTMRQ